MTIELIEIVPLTNNYTQIPNDLINADISNDLFRVCAWLLSLRGGSISSRQIAKAGKLGYNGKPHRRVMAELREFGVITVRPAYAGKGVHGKLLQINLSDILSVAKRAKETKSLISTKRTNRSAKRTKGGCVSYQSLKTKGTGACAPQDSAKRPCAANKGKTRSDVASEMGLPVYDPKTGELIK